MIEKAVYELLAGDSVIFSAVGSRLYPHVKTGKAPAPYIVYTQVTGNPSVTISAADGQQSSTLQVDVYDEDPSNCRAYADMVKNALHKFSGTQSGVAIQYILMQSQRPDYDQEAELHRMTLEFIAKHN